MKQLVQEEYTEILRNCVKELSFYDGKNDVGASKTDNGISLWYRTIHYVPLREWHESTRFDIEINSSENLIDILNFHVLDGERRKGYGTEMIESIDSFAKEIEIPFVRVFPSGIGKYFYPELGFTPINPGELGREVN